MLDGGEELNRVQSVLLEVSRNVARKLPHTLEHEFRDSRLGSIGKSTVGRERFYKLLQQTK